MTLGYRGWMAAQAPLPHIGFKLMATGKCTLVLSRSRTRLKRVKTKSARLKHPTRHPFMSLCEWSYAQVNGFERWKWCRELREDQE